MLQIIQIHAKVILEHMLLLCHQHSPLDSSGQIRRRQLLIESGAME